MLGRTYQANAAAAAVARRLLLSAPGSGRPLSSVAVACRLSDSSARSIISAPARPIAATGVLRTPPSSQLSSTSTHRRWMSAEASSEAVASEPAPPPPAAASASASASTEEEGTPPFVATPDRKYQYFANVRITESGVGVVTFDHPTKKVNTLSFAVMEEAQRLWNAEIHDNDAVRSVVFASAKDGCFVAGADIYDIASVEDKSDLVPEIERALGFFRRMKSKGVPMVAAIDGTALGGGLEWALWCDYRICTDGDKTKMGLPEVKLGLLPGFGGTVNLTDLVGVQGAMDMMLTGKDVRPKKAKKMGLVDTVVSAPALEKVAIAAAEGLADGSVQKSGPKKKSLMNRFIEDTPPGRHLMWKKIEEMVRKNTGGNYPAPEAIVDVVKYGSAHPNPDDKLRNERETFAKLAATTESEALIGIFDGMNRLKKHPYGSPARPVKTVAVMGAGLMGAGIAQVTAEKGYKVLLKDRDDAAVARGVSYMSENWDKKVKRKRMTQHKRNLNDAAVVPLTDASPSLERHFSKADVVIEAVFEDLALKRAILSQIEKMTPSHTVFATNTSAIPISSIAEGSQRPQNVVGMHYFSPVPSMPLLEIIPHGGTSDEALAAAFEVGTKQGKTCVAVKDVPGFYVNRSLGPYLVEVSALLKAGVDPLKIDNAMTKFGMPVGPITLADEVGMDVSAHVFRFLSEADLGVRMSGGDVGLMEGMTERGWLGKKSGKGFFLHGKGKKKGGGKEFNPEAVEYLAEFAGGRKLDLDETAIQNRLVSRFVNEAVKCLEDGIVADPVAGDIGLVFGTGFAPFRGGPFRYLDAVGADGYVDMMDGLAEEHGPQFEPCQLMRDYARGGKKFHG